MARLWGCTFVIGERKNENCGRTSWIETSGEMGALLKVCILICVFCCRHRLRYATPTVNKVSPLQGEWNSFLFVSIVTNFVHGVTVCKDFLNVLLAIVDFVADA